MQLTPVEKIFTHLENRGANLTIYDPMFRGEEVFGAKGSRSLEEAVRGVDCVLVSTAHDEFRNLDLAFLGQICNMPAVFAGYSEPGVGDVFDNLTPPSPTVDAVLDLAEAGIKVHSVLCGPDEAPESLIYGWYADVSCGHFVPGPERIVPVVTSNPTWIVKITTVTPFDSFQLSLASSPPTQRAGYYRFETYVDFYCKAIPWHE